MHFCYTPTEANKQWTAFVAGPTMWFECHCVGKTKPCLEFVTDGELECPMCQTLKPCEQIGYMPLYRELDGKPVMVLVHESVREVVDSHRFLARVLIGRGKDSTDGVYVQRPMSKGTPFSSTLPDRQKPADIWPTLVRMWKIPALIEWDARQSGQKPGGVIHPHSGTAYVPSLPTAPPRPSVTRDDKSIADLIPNILARFGPGEHKADDRTALDKPDVTDGGE